jgi:hypothetical protein
MLLSPAVFRSSPQNTLFPYIHCTICYSTRESSAFCLLHQIIGRRWRQNDRAVALRQYVRVAHDLLAVVNREHSLSSSCHQPAHASCMILLHWVQFHGKNEVINNRPSLVEQGTGQSEARKKKMREALIICVSVS